MSPISKSVFDSRVPESSIADRRAAVKREEEDRVALRRKFLAAMISPVREPRSRIRLWEQLHAMHLPRAAQHRLLAVIADQTALTVEQIHEEQARRAAAASGEATALKP